MLTCWPTCCAPTATASRPLAPQSDDDPRAARAGALARRSGGHPRALANQLRSLLRVLLARRGLHLRRHRLAHRAGVPRALPYARVGRSPGPQAHGRLLRPALQRPAQPRVAGSGCTRPPASVCAAADGGQGRARVAAWRAVCSRLVEQIRLLSQPHRALRRRSLDDGKIIMSFPRAGRVCAAQILAELGDVRERFASDDQLGRRSRRRARDLPVGQVQGVAFRWACNHRLRAAITCLADNSRHANAWAAQHLRQAPGPAAATIPMPSASWPALGCASSGAPGPIAQPYDPAQHRAAQLLKTNGG